MPYKNREDKNANRAAYCDRKSDDPHFRARRLYDAALQRTRKRGTEFALTVEWIRERIEAGHCEVTGIPFEFDGRPWSPSLDRIDNTLGYTTDNVQVVVWTYNAAKGTGTSEDVLTMARALTNESNRQN